MQSYFDENRDVEPHLKFAVSTDAKGAFYEFLDYGGRRLHVWVTMEEDIVLPDLDKEQD